MDYGTLRVTTPDGQVREYPMNTSPVVIGRADSNRVVIDHVSVSRRHARFLLDDTGVKLEDLGSASGTYVNGEQLQPEEPRAIKPGELIRFGDAQAVFMTADTPLVAEPTPAPTPVVPPREPEAIVAEPDPALVVEAPLPPPPLPPIGRPAPPAATDQAIVVSLISPTEPIAAGATMTATCAIENRGAEMDQVVIEVQNLPEGWSRVTRPTMQLPPGGRDEITIVLQPPQTPEARAGEHTFAVAARSQLRGVEVRALGRMTILPFGGHSITLNPVRSTGAFEARVKNESNNPQALTLSGHDESGALTVTLTPATLTLEPGQEHVAKVAARPSKGRFFGSEQIYRFEVAAQGPLAKDTAVGEVRYRPPWLLVRWFVLAAVVGAVGVGAFIGYNAFTGDDETSDAGRDSTASPPRTATTERTVANPTGTAAPATAAPTRATQPPGPTPTAAATLLPSVTPPPPQSRLGSGITGQVIAATNLYVEPSGGARIIQPLAVGDRVIVVTNTPASSTLVITEGLIFWRVVIEGTATVGWLPEVTSAGDRRFVDQAR